MTGLRRRGQRAAASVPVFPTEKITDWMRHPIRLYRHFDRKRFGDCGYARGDFVAERRAVFLCPDLGLALDPREDHAAFIVDRLQVCHGTASGGAADGRKGAGAGRLRYARPSRTLPYSDELLELEPICCLTVVRSLEVTRAGQDGPFDPAMSLGLKSVEAGLRHLPIRAKFA